jgi:hypothetical protein
MCPKVAFVWFSRPHHQRVGDFSDSLENTYWGLPGKRRRKRAGPGPMLPRPFLFLPLFTNVLEGEFSEVPTLPTVAWCPRGS